MGCELWRFMVLFVWERLFIVTLRLGFSLVHGFFYGCFVFGAAFGTRNGKKIFKQHRWMKILPIRV